MYIFRESEFSRVLHLSVRSICIFCQLPPDVSRFLATGAYITTQLTTACLNTHQFWFSACRRRRRRRCVRRRRCIRLAASTAAAIIHSAAAILVIHSRRSQSLSAAAVSCRCLSCRPAALDQEARAVIVVVVVDAGRPSSSRRGRGHG